MTDVDKDEQLLIEAFKYLNSLPQFQVVKKFLTTRLVQTESTLRTCKNDEILEARGCYKESKKVADYINR